MDEIRSYYAEPGPFTALGPHAAKARVLPADLQRLSALVQGLLVHPHMGALYGLDPAMLHHEDTEIRSAHALVDRLLERDPSPLDVSRAPERRFVGNCRHHSLLLCALLRARGAPARARCGFASYFEPGRFVDHWVCEVWDTEQGSWRLVDAQLDVRQRDLFKIKFDPQDVPREAFLVAGDAWLRCREGRANPMRFGILDMWGSWFVRGNLVRDVASLSKRELLPWDVWGMMAGPDAVETADDLALLDRAAELSRAGDEAHVELRKLHDEHAGFRVPRRVFSAVQQTEVDLGPEF